MFVLLRVTAMDRIFAIFAFDIPSFALPTFHADAATTPKGVPVLIVNDVPSGVL